MCHAASLGLLLATVACQRGESSQDVANPHPVALRRPVVAPLSLAAQIGAQVFRDTTLSAAGHLACITCHDPRNAYAPINGLAVQRGGLHGEGEGSRATLSLRYAGRAANFTIGPEPGEDQVVTLHERSVATAGTTRARKSAGVAPLGVAMVPQGGLFWDGRANTLQDQAMGPMFDVNEMGNTDVELLARRIRNAPYYLQLVQLFGAPALAHAATLIDETLFTVARFQLEDSSLHPYSSKYDAYLEGRRTLTPSEARGLRAFEDTARGNCAGCHISRPSADGLPPTFTDQQFEALGVPRNRTLAVNRDNSYFDLGLCGPVRRDMVAETQYCGMFRTPSLRNVATRKVFFHNGVYQTLEQVLMFYNLRDVNPDSIYHGTKFDDVPARFRGNVDTVDAPLNRKRGGKPAMSAEDIRDIVAFLGTLTDQPTTPRSAISHQP